MTYTTQQNDQPLNIFFDLNIGGVSKIFYYPEMPVSFTMEMDQGLTTVTIVLFDQTGFEFEPAIWNSTQTSQNGLPSGTLSFGYLGSNPVSSKTYTFQIESYTPKFVGNAFTLTIIGTIILTPMLSTNQVSGTVEEIVNTIANNHTYTVNINPPFSPGNMLSSGYIDADTTSKSEITLTKWSSETDASFMERVLGWARDSQGRGGYRMYQTCDASGKPVLNIVLPQDKSASIEYVVQDPDTTVIAWEPDVTFSGIMWNADQGQHHSYQPLSGDTQKIVGQQDVITPFITAFGGQTSSPKVLPSPPPDTPADQLIYYCSETMPDNVTGAAGRTRGGASFGPYAGINPFLNQCIANFMENWGATLTVLGDPSLEPTLSSGELQNVEVTCYYPHNYKTGNTTSSSATGQTKHYTSGTYMIDKVTHIIKAGSYQTVLELSRGFSDTPSTQDQQ